MHACDIRLIKRSRKTATERKVESNSAHCVRLVVSIVCVVLVVTACCGDKSIDINASCQVIKPEAIYSVRAFGAVEWIQRCITHWRRVYCWCRIWHSSPSRANGGISYVTWGVSHRVWNPRVHTLHDNDVNREIIFHRFLLPPRSAAIGMVHKFKNYILIELHIQLFTNLKKKIICAGHFNFERSMNPANWLSATGNAPKMISFMRFLWIDIFLSISITHCRGPYARNNLCFSHQNNVRELSRECW